MKTLILLALGSTALFLAGCADTGSASANNSSMNAAPGMGASVGPGGTGVSTGVGNTGAPGGGSGYPGGR